MQSLSDATKIRISRRSYDGTPLKDHEKARLLELISTLNDESGLSMSLCVDEPEAFSLLRHTYGLFSGVRNYIVLAGPDDALTAEKLGYYGEKVALTAVSMGLGTCFVGASFDKSFVDSHTSCSQSVFGVITVGSVSKESLREKTVRSFIHRGIRTASDISSVSTTAPQWFYDGVDCALTAPSAMNKFPVVFRFDGKTASAHVPDRYMYQRMDLGIAKLHFELAANGKWDFGNGAVFHKNNES